MVCHIVVENTGAVYLVIGCNCQFIWIVVQCTFHEWKVAGSMDACLRNICCVFVEVERCNVEGNMEEVIDKKPVIATLRNMQVGSDEVFSIDQKVTVMNTITCRLDKERRSGMKWSCVSDRERGVIIVTRVS